MNRTQAIAENLRAVHERIDRAIRGAGREPDSVRLIAVSKTMPVEDIQAALAAGQLDFGENYAQELRDKRAAFEAQGQAVSSAPRWHYIGPLQRNKVKYLAGRCELIHAVESADILDEINRRVPDGEVQACLVQVNVAGETQKHGMSPDTLPALLDRFADFPRVQCRGLMLIPPIGDDPEETRPHFAALRALRDREAARTRANVQLAELSMGMSHDFEVAIAEGATLVRVGTAIFGPRA